MNRGLGYRGEADRFEEMASQVSSTAEEIHVQEWTEKVENFLQGYMFSNCIDELVFPATFFNLDERMVLISTGRKLGLNAETQAHGKVKHLVISRKHGGTGIGMVQTLLEHGGSSNRYELVAPGTFKDVIQPPSVDVEMMREKELARVQQMEERDKDWYKQEPDAREPQKDTSYPQFVSASCLKDELEEHEQNQGVNQPTYSSGSAYSMMMPPPPHLGGPNLPEVKHIIEENDKKWIEKRNMLDKERQMVRGGQIKPGSDRWDIRQKAIAIASQKEQEPKGKDKQIPSWMAKIMEESESLRKKKKVSGMQNRLLKMAGQQEMGGTTSGFMGRGAMGGGARGGYGNVGQQQQQRKSKWDQRY